MEATKEQLEYPGYWRGLGGAAGLARPGREPGRFLSSPQPPAPLRYPNYKGCIEMDSLNEEVVSLYNFQRTFHLDTAAQRPCTR